jgi:hypothetical protein
MRINGEIYRNFFFDGGAMDFIAEVGLNFWAIERMLKGQASLFRR